MKKREFVNKIKPLPYNKIEKYCNMGKYDTILKNLELDKEDALFSIFDGDVRRLMRLAETKKKRLLILDKMLEVF